MDLSITGQQRQEDNKDTWNICNSENVMVKVRSDSFTEFTDVDVMNLLLYLLAYIQDVFVRLAAASFGLATPINILADTGIRRGWIGIENR